MTTATPYARRHQLKGHLENLFPGVAVTVTIDTPLMRTNGVADGTYKYILRLRGKNAGLVTDRELAIAMKSFDAEYGYIAR